MKRGFRLLHILLPLSSELYHVTYIYYRTLALFMLLFCSSIFFSAPTLKSCRLRQVPKISPGIHYHRCCNVKTHSESCPNVHEVFLAFTTITMSTITLFFSRQWELWHLQVTLYVSSREQIGINWLTQNESTIFSSGCLHYTQPSIFSWHQPNPYVHSHICVQEKWHCHSA